MPTLVRRVWEYDPTTYAPARYRKACAYEAFVPDRLAETHLALGGEVLGVVSDAEAEIRSLNTDAQPALAPLARLLLRTESIASSKVEGLQVNTRDLARAEVRRDTGGRVGPDARDILANIDAMQAAIERAAEADGLAPSDLTSIHRTLMKPAPNSQIAGQIRDSQNWIGGNDYNPCEADFVPPPEAELERLLADLCDASNDEYLPPLVQAALVHAQFETIHPFDDGNGRTGRALIQVILRRRRLAPDYVPPISIVLAGNKGAYIKGLVQFRDGDLGTWIEGFAAAAAEAAQRATHYLRRVRDLQEEWREDLRATGNPRSDAAAWSLIDWLPAYPVVSLPVAIAATGRSKPAVSNALNQLVGAGILLQLSESKKNRGWEARGLFDVMATLEP